MAPTRSSVCAVVILSFALLAAGCATSSHGLSNQELGQLYEHSTGEVCPKETNVGLYLLYPVYGLPMDIVDSPFGLLIAAPGEIAKGTGPIIKDMLEKKEEDEAINLGEAVFMTIHGVVLFVRLPFVLIDDAFFRHGSGDYHTIGVREGNPNTYFFPHLLNWPFRPYDGYRLTQWAQTEGGARRIKDYLEWSKSQKGSGKIEEYMNKRQASRGKSD